MVDFLIHMNEIFWHENVWLPPNITWKDITSGTSSETRFRSCKHLYIPIPMAFILIGLRCYLERHWLTYLGIKLGIKIHKPRKPSYNPVLEKAYPFNEKMNRKKLHQLTKQLNWSERKVERWLRQRRRQDRQTILVKFCESSWRFIYYFSNFIFGIVIMWNKPWLWNLKECWYNYPKQSITDDVWWYYMISLTFYWSLCFSQFFDVKRKDFWQMFIHHIIAIALMSFSWVTNFYRMGTVILITHDCADVFLEAAKMAKYSGYQRICDTLFAVFTLLWISTRLGVYPFWIIHSTSVEAPKIIPMFPAYYIFNGLLILLLMLHIFWTYLILKIVCNSLTAGCMERDIRSSSEYSNVSSKSQ